MKKNFRHLILSVAAIMAFSGCQEKLRNTEELVDPWLRERTPVNVRLESQIGPAIIGSDWRTDSLGTISVSLVTPELDMKAVKVVALDFAYPESEFCPTASIKPGDTIDLSDGTEEFVVTAKTGETRTYTITYTNFKDPLEGCYSHDLVPGLLDAASAPKASIVMIGGWLKNPVYLQIMDKWWQWDTAHNPRDEHDNIMSFRLDRADDQTGYTYGTIYNHPGEDGKYADYVFNADGLNGDPPAPRPIYDANEKYRLIPIGKSRWSKLGDGLLNIHSYDDVNYEKPLFSLELLTSNEEGYSYWKEEGEDYEKVVFVQNLAFHRSFGPGPFQDYSDDGDARFYVTNLRNLFWMIKKDSDQPLENHSELLAK